MLKFVLKSYLKIKQFDDLILRMVVFKLFIKSYLLKVIY